MTTKRIEPSRSLTGKKPLRYDRSDETDITHRVRVWLRFYRMLQYKQQKQGTDKCSI